MITSRQNQKIKDIRRLRRSKGDRTRALLEGPHLVTEALAAGLEVETVFMVPGFLDEGAEGTELRTLTAALPEPPTEVAPELLEELADADSPRGLVAVVRLPRGGVGTLPVRSNGVYLYLEGLQDPGNLGALARSAEAAGAAGLALSPGTVHPNHPRALRGSAGSLLRLPTALGVAPDELEEHLRAGGAAPRWTALAPREGTVLWRADLSGCLVLALGAEGPGLSPELEDRSGLHLTIPLAEPVESLNATVAASLVLFEIRRRRAPTATDS